MIKVVIQNIPARTYPLKIQPHNFSCIKKKTQALSLNRSPHIDKRSQEQFTFQILHRIFKLKPNRATRVLCAQLKNLQTSALPLRVIIIHRTAKQFHTTF